MHKEGEKHARRGYWGDIIVSPYVAIGIKCEDESFFKKANRNFVKVCVHVLLCLNKYIMT